MAAKPPTAARINARAAKDRAFLKRALKNPGLRSRLDPKYLSGTQRKSRTLNTRLNAPIVPGSTTTERDLAHEAGAAQTVRYGPQERELGQTLGVAQQTERDTGSFYDQYQAQLAQHAQNVQAFQAGAQQALAGTAAGITGLSGQQGAAMQQQANQGAAQQGVAQAGNLLPDASAAVATRQALLGSFQAQQAQQGAAANTFADTRANVVAPAEKLAARAQAAGRTRDVRKQITGLRTEEGAYNQQFREQRRADEAKNILAAQVAGVNASAKQTAAEIAGARVTETTRHNKAAEANARAGQKSKADAAAGKVNQYGYTTAAWSKMSTGERQRIIKDFKSSGSKPKTGKGPDWKTSEAMSRGMSQLNSLKGYASKAKAGQAFVAGHQPSGRLPRNGPNSAASKIQASVKAPDDPVLLTAALDAVYDGHLSAATVKKLIAAGYKPSRVASTLGVPTSANYKPPARPVLQNPWTSRIRT